MPVFIDQQIRLIGSYLPNILAAILILIVGYIVAKIVSSVVGGILKRTSLDNRIARSLGGGTGLEAENAISTAVFWLIMLFVLVGFFQTLALSAISEPLNALVAQVLAFIPRLLGAVVLLVLAWIVATALKRVVTGVLGGMGIDRRLNTMVRDEAPADDRPTSSGSTAATSAAASTVAETGATGRVSLADTLGDVVYWLVWLLFLPAILGTLALEGILAPVQNLLNEVFGYLPNIFAAILIGVIGWFVARIIRKIVTSLLAAAGVDRLGERVGLSGVMGGQTLSGLIGLVAYVFILVPVMISALNALDIAAITGPATNMLNTFMAAIPNIFAAAVVLAISFVVGRLVAGLVSSLLAGIGFNSLPARLGLGRAATAATRPPSDVVGSLVLVAVMLFAAIEAARLLGFVALANLMAGFIVLGGQIVLGLIVFAIGLYLANLAAGIVASSGVSQAGLLALVTRVAIMVLAGAMALNQMGLAEEIVNLSFGLVLGAVAVAAALAFGLGGREAAGRQLEQWVQRVKSDQPVVSESTAMAGTGSAGSPPMEPAPAGTAPTATIDARPQRPPTAFDTGRSPGPPGGTD